MSAMVTRLRSRKDISKSAPTAAVPKLISKPRISKKKKKEVPPSYPIAPVPRKASIKASIMALPPAAPVSTPLDATKIMGFIPPNEFVLSLTHIVRNVYNTCISNINTTFATDGSDFQDSFSVYAFLFNELIYDRFTLLLFTRKINFPYRKFLAEALVTKLQGSDELVNNPNYDYSKARAELANVNMMNNLTPQQIPAGLFGEWLGLRMEAMVAMILTLVEIITNREMALTEWTNADNDNVSVNIPELVRHAQFDLQLLVRALQYNQIMYGKFKTGEQVVSYLPNLNEVVPDDMVDLAGKTIIKKLMACTEPLVTEISELTPAQKSTAHLLYTKDKYGDFIVAALKTYDF